MPLPLPDPQLPADPRDALESIQRNFEALVGAIVGTEEIADGAVTGDKIAASTTTTATNESGVTGTLTARKYADGLVVLQGTLDKSSGSWSGTTTTIATLSVGYRPSDLLRIPIYAVAGFTQQTVFCQINSDGSILLGATSSTTQAQIHGITFHAA